MYLKRLEIFGFKSFAKKTVMEFEPGITAIVGPNGSGKSNVADALRWVLGEQSKALIRGKKSDDVIFAGSDKKTKLSVAEVFVVFDNADRKISFDAPEVSIGRRIDRSGESEYLINSQKVRLLDIVELILKSNIGTSRYTVIGQGTIDQMILSGPAEVKSLLDEASGIKSYQLKRENTLKRLDQTAQNLIRAKDLSAEIEPRLKMLRRQAKRLEMRDQIEKELLTLRTSWYGYKLHHARTALVLTSNAVDREKQQEESLSTSLNDTQHQIARFSESQRDLVAHISVEQKQLASLQSDRNVVLEELSLLKGKLQSLNTGSQTDPTALKVHIHGLTRQIENYEISAQDKRLEINRLNQDLERIRTTLHKLASELSNLYALVDKPEEVNIGDVQQSLSSIDDLCNDFCSLIEMSESLYEIKSAVPEFRVQYKNLVTHGSSERQDIASKKADLHLSIRRLNEEKERFSAELQKIQLAISEGTVTLNFAHEQINKLSNEKRNLEFELQKASQVQTQEIATTLIDEESKVNTKLQHIDHHISAVTRKVEELEVKRAEFNSTLQTLEQTKHDVQNRLFRTKDQLTNIVVDHTRAKDFCENLETEALRYLGETAYSDVRNVESPVEPTPGTENRISQLAKQIDILGGVDDLTLQEYQETENRYSALTTQISDLERAMQDLKEVMDELDEHIKKQFNEAFVKVNDKFEEYFRLLFNGGRAYLAPIKDTPKDTLSASQDEVNDTEPDQQRPEEKLVEAYEKQKGQVVGIDIKATPPGKKLASIQALSGGERALTSIALLCSLLTCFPSPFVVLDEVDAALDEANTIRFGQILGNLSDITQFVTITHNRETMARSSTLYGVTMGDDGISKLLSIKFDQAQSYAK